MNKTTAHKLGITLAGVLALIVLPAGVHAAALAYTVTDLGIAGGSYSVGNAINATGQVAGYSSDGHAVRWSGTTPTDLGVGRAFAINIFGQAAGDTNGRAVRWTGVTPEDLGTLGGASSYAHGINDSGQVVGESYSLGGNSPLAFLYQGSSMTAIPTLGGTTNVAYGINASGQITGSSETTGNAFQRAFLYSGTSVLDIGTLGGTASVGKGINASGWVTGQSTITGDQEWHAFLYNGTSMNDLGTLGGVLSHGHGINASGDVTGMSLTLSGAQHGFLYSEGAMYDLNDLIVPGSGVTDIEVGFGINDSGQIATYGTIGGQTHALRLNPVATPEPASAALLIAGGALLGLRRRR